MSKHINVIPKNEDFNKAHHDALQKFKKKNKRFPNSKDPEFWEMSEVYKTSYQVLVDEANLEQTKLDRLAEKEDENPVFSKKKIVVERLCAHPDCEVIIPPSGKRGRPASKCVDHRKVSK